MFVTIDNRFCLMAPNVILGSPVSGYGVSGERGFTAMNIFGNEANH